MNKTYHTYQTSLNVCKWEIKKFQVYEDYRETGLSIILHTDLARELVTLVQGNEYA